MGTKTPKYLPFSASHICTQTFPHHAEVGEPQTDHEYLYDFSWRLWRKLRTAVSGVLIGVAGT